MFFLKVQFSFNKSKIILIYIVFYLKFGACCGLAAYVLDSGRTAACTANFNNHFPQLVTDLYLCTNSNLLLLLLLLLL